LEKLATTNIEGFKDFAHQANSTNRNWPVVQEVASKYNIHVPVAIKLELPGSYIEKLKSDLETYRGHLHQLEANAAELRRYIRGLEVALEVATNEKVSPPSTKLARDWWEMVKPEFAMMTAWDAIRTAMAHYPEGANGNAIGAILLDERSLSPKELRAAKKRILCRLGDGCRAGYWQKLDRGIYAPLQPEQDAAPHTTAVSAIALLGYVEGVFS
jgi:hypothetical protein